YHLLTGTVPFTGPMQSVMAQILFHPPPPLRQHRPGLDPRLEAICLQAMAKQPGERHRSGQAFARALEEWLAGQAAPVQALAATSEPPTLDAPPVALPVSRPGPALAGLSAATEPVPPEGVLPQARGRGDRAEEGTAPVASQDTLP